MAKTYTVKLERLNPVTEKEPHFDEYQVPIEEGWSILNILAYIYDELDPSVCYYGSCRVGKCVACHVKVNGRTRLALYRDRRKRRHDHRAASQRPGHVHPGHGAGLVPGQPCRENRHKR